MRLAQIGASLRGVKVRIARVLASPWSDGLLAFAILALGEFELWSGERYQGGPVFPGPKLVVALLVIPAITLPLALRRRRAVAAYVVVAAAVTVDALAFGGDEATAFFLAFLVAVYSAAANIADRRIVVAAAAVAIGVHELRDPHERSLGSIVWACGFVAIAILFGLAVRRRNSHIVVLESDREELAREAVAQERARIARELHDVVAHAVSVVVVQSQAGQRLVGVDDAEARKSLEVIESTARSALGEMRRLLGLLRDADGVSLAPQPTLGDLGALVEQVRGAGLPVSFAVEGEPVELPPGIELSAYRIVQEGLTNALKHATGAPARVVVRYGASALELEIVDEGQAEPAASGGFGLAGMRERVGFLGGSVHAGPRPDGGWSLRALLPIHD
jgi:signal transduction histidine kinase